MTHFDHIVVGGGIAGMTAALLLAKSGASVALIEKSPFLSPTVRGYKKSKVHFDTGLHYVGGLGDGDPLDVYFKHLGIAGLIEKKPYNPKGFDLFCVETTGKSYQVPSGFDQLRDQLTEDFPQEVETIENYIGAIKGIINTSPFLNFNKEFSLESAFHDDGRTLKEFLNQSTDNEDLQALLSYQTLLYGTPPEEAALTTHALVAGSYILSAHTLKGGGKALVKAYEKRLADLGITVRRNVTVTRVEINDSRSVTGVTLSNSEHLSTHSCVWTAHPQGLTDVTPANAFRPAFKKRLSLLEDTVSALMLFGISEEPIPELDGQNLILWPGHDFSKNLTGTLPPEESVIYLSAAEDPQSGEIAITAIMPQEFAAYSKWQDSCRGKRPQAYLDHKHAALKTFENEIFRRVPSIRNTVSFVDGATPLTLKDFCATPTGGLYGLRHSVNQFNPAPVTKVTGLTLAGQGTVAPGILGAVVSAYLTCGIILGHEALHKELRHYA